MIRFFQFSVIIFATIFQNSYAIDLPELLIKLSRIPVRTANFTETLTTEFLEKPVVSSGNLKFIAPSTLIKRLTYPEVVEQRIEDDFLSIYQGTEIMRTISLESHPEIAIGIYAIRWVLSGNLAALNTNFSVIFSETGNKWRIELAPADSDVASVITNITVSGKDDHIGRVVIKQANGDILSTELYENF